MTAENHFLEVDYPAYLSRHDVVFAAPRGGKSVPPAAAASIAGGGDHVSGLDYLDAPFCCFCNDA